MPRTSESHKTPTLVICGEQDYRVPYTQSLEFYTALQRQDVPSKLIVFPDEGHWILKPQNAIVWYRKCSAGSDSISIVTGNLGVLEHRRPFNKVAPADPAP